MKRFKRLMGEPGPLFAKTRWNVLGSTVLWTVAGIAQLMGSLKAEAAQQGAPVGVHTLSPGMVLTDLLLEGASDTNKQARSVHIFNGFPLQRCWFALRL